MDFKIIKKTDNPSLSRREMEAEGVFSGKVTPKREDVKKDIASLEKVDDNLVVIKHISTSFGSGKIHVLAYVYGSEKDLKEVEPKKKGTKPAEGGAKEASEGEPAPKDEAEEAPAPKRE